ncbi:hypothetical protein TNCV_2393181 [Trichonephila clavipes]|nr:hypothetical protein TNCV_2393181 [Trichonephila clavipes]
MVQNSVTKSPRVAEQCDVNIHSLTAPKSQTRAVIDKRDTYLEWSHQVDSKNINLNSSLRGRPPRGRRYFERRTPKLIRISARKNNR